MEKIVKQYGFDSLKEFNRMVVDVDLTSIDKLKAFRDWQENDGTKNGLLKIQRPIQKLT